MNEYFCFVSIWCKNAVNNGSENKSSHREWTVMNIAWMSGCLSLRTWNHIFFCCVAATNHLLSMAKWIAHFPVIFWRTSNCDAKPNKINSIIINPIRSTHNSNETNYRRKQSIFSLILSSVRFGWIDAIINMIFILEEKIYMRLIGMNFWHLLFNGTAKIWL